MRGRTIELYLPDADPRSVRECSIKDSIVKAIIIPRNKIAEIEKKEELKEPGIYFLISEEQDFETVPEVYIGETEQLKKRIKQHQNKEWSLAICFFSAKRNLNKAHIRFLEGYCHEMAKKVGRCVLHNDKNPTKSPLINQEMDLALSFFDDLKIIIGTLGFPIFDEIKIEKKNIFYCEGKASSAQGMFSADGMLVLKGSKIVPKELPSAGTWTKNRRRKLTDEGVLKEEEGFLVFTKDYLFNSPSAAAAVIQGRRANGWMEWKDKNGNKIDDLLRKNKNGSLD